MSKTRLRCIHFYTIPFGDKDSAAKDTHDKWDPLPTAELCVTLFDAYEQVHNCSVYMFMSTNPEYNSWRDFITVFSGTCSSVS